MSDIRTDWNRAEIEDIYNTPLLELIYQAATVHRRYHNTGEVQVCTLLSIKTGGCPEDCSYCPQSARYQTDVESEPLMELNDVIKAAMNAKENGSTRFCMGSAWRNARDNKDFDRVTRMISAVNTMGLEVCCTLGMLTEEQAVKLKDAGLYAYNHNLDSGEDFYNKIITTRTYQDRLKTLENVRKADLSVCCGGIIGMGESDGDRLDLLHTLATLPKHPESVPINALVAVKGTPMEGREKATVWEMVRMIATARIVLPGSMVRLSAGRVEMPVTEQALCFMAGANSIFAGDKLLTTPNNGTDQDKAMFALLGLVPRKAFKEETERAVS